MTVDLKALKVVLVVIMVLFLDYVVFVKRKDKGDDFIQWILVLANIYLTIWLLAGE